MIRPPSPPCFAVVPVDPYGLSRTKTLGTEARGARTRFLLAGPVYRRQLGLSGPVRLAFPSRLGRRTRRACGKLLYVSQNAACPAQILGDHHRHRRIRRKERSTAVRAPSPPAEASAAGPRRRALAARGSTGKDSPTNSVEEAMIAHSIEIERPPEEVFAYLGQFDRHGDWQSEIVSAKVETEGPVRVGTRVKEIRKIGRREQETSFEVTEHEPPHKSSFRGVAGPVRPLGTVTVEPIGDGSKSKVSVEFDLVGHGIGKLFAPIARKQARKTIADNQARLKPGSTKAPDNRHERREWKSPTSKI